MKKKFKHYPGIFQLALLVLVAVFVSDTSDTWAQTQAEDSKPNILFIIADDQGWKDLSVAMDERLADSKSDYHQTPNIERIAEGGMRFSNAYAAAPMCSPSRRSLHVGMNAAQVGFGERGNEVAADAMTIGEVMQSAGYATAHFGKWSPGPSATGLEFYDANDGAVSNNGGNVDEPDNPKDIFGITRRAVAFIEESVNAGKPFYMQLSHFAPHVAARALEETIEKWQSIEPGTIHTNPVVAAMTENLDTGVGTVLDKLRELGIEENTYVIYTSDHGQAVNMSPNLPLAHGKGTLWEGGMRVPFIVSGPGIEAGTISDTRVVSLDLFPTYAELAGTTAPNTAEGGNLLPVLRNSGQGEVERPREELVFHFPEPSGQPNSRSSSSVYLGDYKLLKFYDSGELLLFNMAEDPGEQHNLAEQMPGTVEDMHARMADYLSSVNATVPSPSEARAAAEASAARGMGMGAMGMGM